jgi:antitoxin (DNA-binding transcriptional repressor) of toxin-antitoxin stability system
MILMIHVDISLVRDDLMYYLDQVERGETIVVTRDDEPIAEVRPLAAPRQAPRALGLGKGMGEIHPSFFDPLPDDLLDAFHGTVS